MDNLDQYIDMAVGFAMAYVPKLVLAIVVLIVGWWLVGSIVKLLDKSLARHAVEATLQRFLISLTGIMLKVLVIITVASMVGVETTSFIALIGAAGLAIGLALQGSLANFAGGILILLFKPFKAGDYIVAQGYEGDVQEIQIFNTILLTRDNQKVIIPNGLLSNGCLQNVFCEENRRVDITFGISYEDDIAHAKAVLWGVIKANALILDNPESEVYVSAHADSSINLLVRVWARSEDYWSVHFDLYEDVKIAFDRESVSIPFPQRDVHLYQQQG